MSLDNAERLVVLIGKVTELNVDQAHKDELLKYLRWALRKAVQAYWYSTEINVD
jgi:hypothetical protein